VNYSSFSISLGFWLNKLVHINLTSFITINSDFYRLERMNHR
jgi:hypothetical protein